MPLTHGSSSSSPMAPTASFAGVYVGQKSPEKMICWLHPSSNFWEGGGKKRCWWWLIHHASLTVDVVLWCQKKAETAKNAQPGWIPGLTWDEHRFRHPRDVAVTHTTALNGPYRPPNDPHSQRSPKRPSRCPRLSFLAWHKLGLRLLGFLEVYNYRPGWTQIFQCQS